MSHNLLWLANHLIKVVDTFQCVCVLSNFQHLNLHLHVLFTLNFELGQFTTLFFGGKNKIVEIDLQLAKEWNYQEYHAKDNLKQFLLDCLV